MNEALKIAIINLIANIGIQAAIDILSGIHNAATIDDALIALRESAKKDWAAYKAEAAANG